MNLHQQTQVTDPRRDVGESLPEQHAPAVPASGLRVRAGRRVLPAQDPAPGTQAGERGLHAHPGEPNPRLTETASPAAGAPDHGDYVNHRIASDSRTIAGPTQNRAGSTSADRPRPAKTSHAFTVRPFDKWRNPTPGAVPKISQPAPRAAQAPMVGRPVGTRPSRMGNAPDTPTGRILSRANTFRLIPTPWDEQLITEEAPGQVQTTARRASGWRAR